VGVPLITPEVAFTERPVGSGVAAKPVGELFAVIGYEKAVPTVPLALEGLVITGIFATGAEAVLATKFTSPLEETTMVPR
jgi:hypothetical protein